MASYFIKITSGGAQGPFNIYYNVVSSLTKVASNIDKSTLTSGYDVIVPNTATSIILENTQTGCNNTVTVLVPSITPTPTATATPTATLTNTPTSTSTLTPGITPSSTATNTPTNTPTQTITPSQTTTRSATPTPTLTSTARPTPTLTRTPAETPSPTTTPTPTLQALFYCPAETINNALTASGFSSNDYYVDLGTTSGTVCLNLSIISGSNDTCSCVLIYYGSDLINTVTIPANQVTDSSFSAQFTYNYNATSGSQVHVLHVGPGGLCTCDIVPTPTSTPTPTITPTHFTPTPTPTVTPTSFLGETVTFTAIDFTTHADYIAPGRGWYYWNGVAWDGSGGGGSRPYINLLNPDGGATYYNQTDGTMDDYHRMKWIDLQKTSNPSSYDFAGGNTNNKLIRQYNLALSKGKKFSTGVEIIGEEAVGSQPYVPPFITANVVPPSLVPGVDPSSSFASYYSYYYLFNKGTAFAYLINYNHPDVLTYLENLLKNMNAANGGPLDENKMLFMDIRLYGSTGEWHCFMANGGNSRYYDLQTQLGFTPTLDTYKKLVTMHLTAFPNTRFVIPILSTLPHEAASWHDVPAAFSDWLFQQYNNAGYIGIREDGTGKNAGEIAYEFENYDVPGYNLSAIRKERWKYAITTGEPLAVKGVNCGTDTNYSCLYYGQGPCIQYVSGSCVKWGLGTPPSDMIKYHFNIMANGNFWTSYPDQTVMDLTSKALGYRIILTTGSVSFSPIGVKQWNLGVALNWKNNGNAPTYEVWDVYYQLRDSSDVVKWESVTDFNKLSGNTPSNGGIAADRLLLPAMGEVYHQQYFTVDANLSGIPNGTYKLVVIVKDRYNYRQPLPLAIYGRQSYGGYILKSNIIIS